jgi:hypothetical protein
LLGVVGAQIGKIRGTALLYRKNGVGTIRSRHFKKVPTLGGRRSARRQFTPKVAKIAWKKHYLICPGTLPRLGLG